MLAGGLERVRDLEVPDPTTTQPMCEVLKAVRILRHEIGDRAFIMGRADQALYHAKTHGRNQTCFYEDLIAQGTLKAGQTNGEVEFF